MVKQASGVGSAAVGAVVVAPGADVVVVDMGVATDLEDDSGIVSRKIGYGTKNLAKGPAMTRDEAVQAIEAGIDVVESIEKLDVLATGEMGIGNTTPSSAIIAAFSGCDVKEVTGRGTGIDDEGISF